MKFAPCAVACLLSAAAFATVRMHGQAGAGQSASDGLILGQVIDADSSQPIEGVVVGLTVGGAAPASTAELVELGAPAAVPAMQRSLTAADGRFLFRNLKKDRYGITAASNGYVNGAYGQGRPAGPPDSIDVGDGQKLGSVTIRLWKTGAIAGTVTDESGEPAIGVIVRSFRRVIAGGRSRFSAGSSGTSDDRGQYRIASQTPGDYVVGLQIRQDTAPLASVIAYIDAGLQAPRNNSEAYRSMSNSAAPIFSSTAGTRVGEFIFRQTGGAPTAPDPAPDGHAMVYQTQFFPAAAAASQATLVTVKSGEERRNLDLQARLVRGFRVSGLVAGPSGPGAFLGVTLAPISGSDLSSEGVAEAASTVCDGSGAFTFFGIGNGQYTLRVRMYPRSPDPVAAGRGSAAPPLPPPTEPTLWAQQNVTVAGADLSGVAVSLRAGLTVSGHVEFSGTRQPPTADQLQRMGFTLQTAEGRTSSPIAVPGRATPDGAFRTAGYPAGRWIMTAQTVPPGWSLKSAMAGGRDVSVEPLELNDTDVSGIALTFTDRITQLSGTIANGRGADPAAEVIVFPADSVAWQEIGVVARRGRDVRASKTGTFAISGLPAGEYFVAAVPSASGENWQDPVFLKSIMNAATRVTLGDGESKIVTVRTIER